MHNYILTGDCVEGIIANWVISHVRDILINKKKRGGNIVNVPLNGINFLTSDILKNA